MKSKLLAAGILATAILGASAAFAPAMAAGEDFSSREGFTASGAPEWRFEIQPYLWLPANSINVGLNRAPSEDISIDTPRPTVAQLLSHLQGAFTAQNTARYGNWVGELNIMYISLGTTKQIPVDLPDISHVNLDASLSEFYVSPGIGYRAFSNDKVGLDARVGFSYLDVTVDANIREDSEPGKSRNVNYVQPWIGERFTWVPAGKWRVVNTLALTGLGADGGRIGWNGYLGASYLVASWFDVTLGYNAAQTYNTQPHGPNGEDRSVNILEYGPVFAMGFRF